MLEFWISFFAMEFVAWALHKYGMHGPLWFLHEDHHRPPKGSFWQRNDLFALFFAIPSFLAIAGGNYYAIPAVMNSGYGVMAYGFAYFLFHEVLIHQRIPLRGSFGWYVDRLILAHRHHHQVATQKGCRNFGMLWLPFQYYGQTQAQKRIS